MAEHILGYYCCYYYDYNAWNAAVRLPYLTQIHTTLVQRSIMHGTGCGYQLMDGWQSAATCGGSFLSLSISRSLSVPHHVHK